MLSPGERERGRKIDEIPAQATKGVETAQDSASRPEKGKDLSRMRMKFRGESTKWKREKGKEMTVVHSIPVKREPSRKKKGGGRQVQSPLPEKKGREGGEIMRSGR